MLSRSADASGEDVDVLALGDMKIRQGRKMGRKKKEKVSNNSEEGKRRNKQDGRFKIAKNEKQRGK